MDEFPESLGGPPPISADGESDDPAAEFLAREQEELAGLEDDIAGALNLNNHSDGGAGGEADGEYRSLSPTPVVSNGPSSGVSHVPPPEPETLRRWREEQQKRLQEKDADEEKKKAEMREAARKELDEWYKTHDEQLIKTRNSNRSAEKELVADTEPMEPGTEWERIAKLCDFNPKASKHTKDISRMRSIILQVKQSPNRRPITPAKN